MYILSIKQLLVVHEIYQSVIQSSTQTKIWIYFLWIDKDREVKGATNLS